MKILGIDVDQITFKEATAKCLKFAKSKVKNVVVTPNPEIILHAQKDKKFAAILNKAHLKIPDGIGIVWAGAVHKEYHAKLPYRYNKWLIGFRHLMNMATKNYDSLFPERVCGSDLMMELCKKFDQKTKVFLLGGGKGVADLAAKNLLKKNKKLNIVGTDSGSADKSNDANLRNIINKSKADVIFVGFGAVKQEFWISRNLKYLTNAKLALGIGGSIDFAAGKITRAPEWMQKFSLEWLYRLIKQPARIKRIFNATVIFPIEYLYRLK